jgi:hypothetical protein
MKNIKRVLCFYLLVLILIGCESLFKEKNWPPTSANKSKILEFKTSTSYNFSGFERVYSGSEIIGEASFIANGDFEINYNLFAISGTEEGYVKSQFEVLYFDDNITQIRAVEEQGDKVAIIMKSVLSPGQVHSMLLGFSNAGARVRCGKKIYELQSDGWYKDGVLVHEFIPEPIKKP